MAKETIQSKQFKDLAERLNLSEGISLLIYMRKSENEMPRRLGSATVKEIAICNWDFEDFCLKKYYGKHGGGEYFANIEGPGPDKQEFKLVGYLASEIEKPEETKDGTDISSIFTGIKELKDMFDSKQPSGPDIAGVIQLLEAKEETRLQRDKEAEERREKEHKRRMDEIKNENENKINMMKTEAENRLQELEKRFDLQTQRDKQYYEEMRQREKESQAERDRNQKLFYAEFQKLTSQDNALATFLKGLDFARDMKGGGDEGSIEGKLIDKGIDLVTTVVANKEAEPAQIPPAPTGNKTKTAQPQQQRARQLSAPAKMIVDILHKPIEERPKDEWMAGFIIAALENREDMLDMILDADRPGLEFILMNILGVPKEILTLDNMNYLVKIQSVMQKSYEDTGEPETEPEVPETAEEIPETGPEIQETGTVEKETKPKGKQKKGGDKPSSAKATEGSRD